MEVWIESSSRFPNEKKIVLFYGVECCGTQKKSHLMISNCSRLHINCGKCGGKASFPILLLLHTFLEDIPNAIKKVWDDFYYEALEGYEKLWT